MLIKRIFGFARINAILRHDTRPRGPCGEWCLVFSDPMTMVQDDAVVPTSIVVKSQGEIPFVVNQGQWLGGDLLKATLVAFDPISALSLERPLGVNPKSSWHC